LQEKLHNFRACHLGAQSEAEANSEKRKAKSKKQIPACSRTA
jgi:hypothetical protein